jgi:hypothetical protein
MEYEMACVTFAKRLRLSACGVVLALISFGFVAPASAHGVDHHRHHHYRYLSTARRHVLLPLQAQFPPRRYYFASRPYYVAPAYAATRWRFNRNSVGFGQDNSSRNNFAWGDSGHNGFGQSNDYAPLDGMASAAASAAGVPQSLVERVIKRESGGNPRAVSRGNYGLMQIRLGTARAMGYSGSAAGLLDAQTNMTYAVRYLAGAYRAAGGNADRAVALYARGYYDVAKSQGFSPYQSGSSSGFAADRPAPAPRFASAPRAPRYFAMAHYPQVAYGAPSGYDGDGGYDAAWGHAANAHGGVARAPLRRVFFRRRGAV